MIRFNSKQNCSKSPFAFFDRAHRVKLVVWAEFCETLTWNDQPCVSHLLIYGRSLLDHADGKILFSLSSRCCNFRNDITCDKRPSERAYFCLLRLPTYVRTYIVSYVAVQSREEKAEIFLLRDRPTQLAGWLASSFPNILNASWREWVSDKMFTRELRAAATKLPLILRLRCSFSALSSSSSSPPSSSSSASASATSSFSFPSSSSSSTSRSRVYISQINRDRWSGKAKLSCH